MDRDHHRVQPKFDMGASRETIVSLNRKYNERPARSERRGTAINAVQISDIYIVAYLLALVCINASEYTCASSSRVAVANFIDFKLGSWAIMHGPAA